MGKIVWDLRRECEMGCSKAVLFQNVGGEYTDGVAWDGITSISRNVDGGEVTPLYSGNRRVGNSISPLEYGFTVNCYSYPEEFEKCIGEETVAPGVLVEQQERSVFGLSYQTINGNAYDPDAGYTIHLIYGCVVSSFECEHSTINTSIEATEFSFEIETIPDAYEGLNALSHIKIRSYLDDPDKLREFEDILYGTNESEPRMPLPEEVADLLTPPAENNGYPQENLYPNVDENPIDT